MPERMADSSTVALLRQAANITAKWHGDNCSTDMCDCMDDARRLLDLANVFAAASAQADEDD